MRAGELFPAAGEGRLVAGVVEEAIEPALRAEVLRPAAVLVDRGLVADVLHRRELRAREAGVRRAVDERRVVALEVIEVAVIAVVRDAGERDAVVEAERGVARADVGVTLPRDAVTGRDEPERQAEVRLERRGRRQLEVPHRERHRDLRLALVGLDRHLAEVAAGLRVGRHADLDPDRAALAGGDVERERVALLAHDVVDVRNERVGPAAGRAVERGGRVQIDHVDAVELHVVDDARPLEARGARGHPVRRAGDHHLEGLELVAGRRDARLGRLARLCVGPDLLRRAGHPHVRSRGKQRGDGEGDGEAGSA